jgi:hypothetical protein
VARGCHIGWLILHSDEHGPVVLGANGTHYLAEGRVEGDDPLAAFSANAPEHLLRTDGFAHVADIMVGSFYDPDLDQGCAFEELISFHGGLGGPQTRPFILYPAHFALPSDPLVGAARVHDVLWDWRAALQGQNADSFSPLNPQAVPDFVYLRPAADLSSRPRACSASARRRSPLLPASLRWPASSGSAAV